MRKNRWIQEYGLIVLTGVVVGLAALILTAAGNPKNMGFCIACFPVSYTHLTLPTICSV